MFYRVATMEDFENAESKFNNIPPHIKQLMINTGNVPKACKDLREFYGYGAYDAKKDCTEFMSFIEAKNDFNKGNLIYTKY